MEVLVNPHRGDPSGIGPPDVPWPSGDLGAAAALYARCPQAAPTPLRAVGDLAAAAGIARLDLKDERARMGLGSFKALGAAYVIARDAEAGRAARATYVTASAGNHGLSVAAGARVFGARAVIYLADTVPEAFATRLRAEGAEVVRDGAVYEDSMAAAARAAETRGWRLLSDSSWPGYVAIPRLLMEGYLILMGEVFDRIEAPPTHIFLQAGVGGLAAAAAVAARAHWGDTPRIVVVEPAFAPALAASIAAGRAVRADGPASAMGRLDCKEPSLVALKGLARDADVFATITEAEAEMGAARAGAAGFATTPSGAAGLAAILSAGPHRAALGLGPASRALAILSEGPEG